MGYRSDSIAISHDMESLTLSGKGCRQWFYATEAAVASLVLSLSLSFYVSLSRDMGLLRLLL